MRKEDLRIAVVTPYPVEDWHSAQLIRACGKLGAVVSLDPAELAATLAGPAVEVSAGAEDASGIDAFLLARGLSPRGDPDVQFAIYRALEDLGVPVVNRIGALLDAQDKFRTSFLLGCAGVATPRVAVAQCEDDAQRAVRAMGEAVLKPLAASLGEGVERVCAGREGEARAAARVRAEGALYVQEWVPNPGRDVRVFVVGGRAVAAVERLASPGEFRTNIARGGVARELGLARAPWQAAERAALALGLDYTGVDIIEGPAGPLVIEVNGNPAFDMIFRATGMDMAEAIAKHVAVLVRLRRAGRDAGRVPRRSRLSSMLEPAAGIRCAVRSGEGGVARKDERPIAAAQEDGHG